MGNGRLLLWRFSSGKPQTVEFESVLRKKNSRDHSNSWSECFNLFLRSFRGQA